MVKAYGTKEKRRKVAAMVAEARSDILCETIDADGFGSVWYWGFDEEKGTIFTGSATNSGVVPEIEIPYDFDNGLGENLAELDRRIHEKCRQNG